MDLLAKKRSRYNSLVATYKKRRLELYNRYGVTGRISTRRVKGELPDKYNNSMAKMSARIQYYSRMMRLIDTYRQRNTDLVKAVAEFTGQDIVFSLEKKGLPMPHAIKIAKGIYYKYGVEVLGISPKWLGDFIGYNRPDYQYKLRNWFTSTFESIPENKQMYLNFKQYYSESKSNT